MTKVKDVVAVLKKHFPEKIASKGDPVGIQIGSLEQNVTKILTTLDVRPQVVDEAVQNGVDLIISHHPLMFRPAPNLNFANPQYAMYGKIIAHGITVYSIHTNSDKADDGSSDWQAEELGLKDIELFVLMKMALQLGAKADCRNHCLLKTLPIMLKTRCR